MKPLSSVLLSFVFVVALGAAATAGTYIDDEENDAYQASNTSLDPQPTRIDIKRAKFTEKRTKFKFKVETYQPVDMVVFCTAADCEDHADKGYLDIDFFTQKKDGGTKRHYFIEVRSADGGMEATLR